jgi:GAF domain-containing protein
MDKIFDVILTKLMRAYGAIAVSIWLVDRKRQKVVCKKALSPGRSKVEGWEIDLGEGFVGISAKEGQSMLISDVAKDSRYFDEVAKETGVTLRSLVSAPIIKKDKILGVIQVLDQEPNMFSQKDVKLIETIAASASVAIENALFYKKIKHLMKELEEYKKELEEYKKTD